MSLWQSLGFLDAAFSSFQFSSNDLIMVMRFCSWQQHLLSSGMKVRKWDDIMLLGPSLCALCIGNEEYSDKKLTNCARDAQRVVDEVRKLPEDLKAEAEVRMNVKDKIGMEKALRDFLAKYAGRLPRTLLFYFSGHGIQTGDTLFLLPTSAGGEGAQGAQRAMPLP